MAMRPRCPNCGNTSSLFIEDNGASIRSALYTLLCTAPVALGDDAFGGEASPPLEPLPGGKVPCAMQWEPNAS